MSTHDVVIIGAAPAGSLAALVLARAGKRVALLDRAAFPRPKVCGNCVNPSTWPIWRRLGLAEGFAALPHHATTGFAIHCEGRPVFEHDFPSPDRGPRVVSREVLDARRSQDPDRFARRYLPPFAPTEWRRLNPITRAHAALTTGRVWLAGDAARVVEPFTGEGIGFALATGVLAAETALHGLAQDDLATARAVYGRTHRAMYRRRAWANLLVHWVLVDPARTVRLVRRMERLPRGVVSLLSRRVHAAT